MKAAAMQADRLEIRAMRAQPTCEDLLKMAEALETAVTGRSSAPQQLVDLVILGGQEDDGEIGFLSQPA